MMRDINPIVKSHGKQHSHVGEQPRKLVDRKSKISSKHKKLSEFHDMDDLSRDRHIYHRAATKNITREILRSSQF